MWSFGRSQHIPRRNLQPWISEQANIIQCMFSGTDNLMNRWNQGTIEDPDLVRLAFRPNPAWARII